LATQLPLSVTRCDQRIAGTGAARTRPHYGTTRGTGLDCADSAFTQISRPGDARTIFEANYGTKRDGPHTPGLPCKDAPIYIIIVAVLRV